MLSLIDQCRAVKEEKHITNKEIADGSGVPLNTVNNFFRASTHSPTVDTIGPICAFLDISMDEYFGKKQMEPAHLPESAEELAAQELSVFCQQIKGLNAQNELLREIIEKQTHGIRIRDHFLFWFFLLFIAALGYAAYLDLHCHDFGFFH